MGAELPRAKLAEVERLATALAARLRYAQMVRQPVPPAQVAALVHAARLMQDHDLPWPPLVEEALQACARDLAGEVPQEAGPEEDRGGVRAGLSRLVGALRRNRSAADEL